MSDPVTSANWHLGAGYHMEQFKTADGKTLLGSQVRNLVQAMATFALPAAGQTVLPASRQVALAPVLAVNWKRPICWPLSSPARPG